MNNSKLNINKINYIEIKTGDGQDHSCKVRTKFSCFYAHTLKTRELTNMTQVECYWKNKEEN